MPPYGKQFGCEWYEDKCISGDASHTPLDADLYCSADVKYHCAADYVGKSNCEVKQYSSSSELSPVYRYFGASDLRGGVLGYADFCPMYYHYSNGDCRIPEASHVYDSFGATISPHSKCTEMVSSDTDDEEHTEYAICYETHCAQHYLATPGRKS